MDYFCQDEPVTSTHGTLQLAYVLQGRMPPTERQLQWMRENIPHFKTAERQARAAKREAAG